MAETTWLDALTTEQGDDTSVVYRWEVWTGRPLFDRRYFNRFKYEGFEQIAGVIALFTGGF